MPSRPSQPAADMPPIPADFTARAAELGVTLTASQLQQLASFVALLLSANARFNLTSIRTPEEAWTRHVLDSLSLAPLLDVPAGSQVVDVGAGGGLPGLVLAIARPDLTFTLIDATGKKVRHIADTARTLGLENVTAIQGRAEDLAGSYRGADGSHRERYDLAVARALAPLPVLLELVTPFLQPGGTFLAIKGQRAEAELAEAQGALATLHTRLEDQQRTPTGTILRLRKTATTPRAYPRRPNEPKRSPL